MKYWVPNELVNMWVNRMLRKPLIGMDGLLIYIFRVRNLLLFSVNMCV